MKIITMDIMVELDDGTLAEARCRNNDVVEIYGVFRELTSKEIADLGNLAATLIKEAK
jgi:hypothetical protein